MREKELKDQYFLLMQDMEMWSYKYREKNFKPFTAQYRSKLKGLDYVDGVPYWDAMEDARNNLFADRIENLFRGVVENRVDELRKLSGAKKK